MKSLKARSEHAAHASFLLLHIQVLEYIKRCDESIGVSRRNA